MKEQCSTAMTDHSQILFMHFKEQHCHEEEGHEGDCERRGDNRCHEDGNTDDPMHPVSEGAEVVADGQHHHWEEDADLDAGQVERVLELQLEEAVAALVQQGKDGDCHEVPEDVAQAGQLDEPQRHEHRDVDGDEVVKGDPEAVPELVLLATLEGQQRLQAHHPSEEHVEREHLAVHRLRLPLPERQQQRAPPAQQVGEQVIADGEGGGEEDDEAGEVLALPRVVVVDLQHQVEQHPEHDVPGDVELAETGHLLWLSAHQQQAKLELLLYLLCVELHAQRALQAEVGVHVIVAFHGELQGGHVPAGVLLREAEGVHRDVLQVLAVVLLHVEVVVGELGGEEEAEGTGGRHPQLLPALHLRQAVPEAGLLGPHR